VASVEDRWFIEVGGERQRAERHGVGQRYRVRYRDPGGAQRTKSFVKKAEADQFAATVEADKVRGLYVDPTLGRITLEEYGRAWLESQTFGASTREATELRLRIHVFPHLGRIPLAALKPSQVQGWLRLLQQELAPRYVRVIFANLSSMLSAAVDDDRIAKNPCSASSVRVPRAIETKLVPWTAEQLHAVTAALPPRYRVMATLGAGCGLRQGEVFGLAVEDIDFLRGVVHVRRQVKIVGGKHLFAPPKGRKVRDVPLPESVALSLAAHMAEWPGISVAMEWEPSGQTVAAKLVLSTRERGALDRNYVNAKIWKAALVRAGMEPSRENGMHALRHFYASVLLDAGESVRALAEYLGHADPGFTLRVYTHLMPASEERTKKAVDRLFTVDGPSSCVPDVSRGAV
jgi:integrase